MEMGESVNMATQEKITTHKSNPTSLVYYESNITDVNHNTWWINSSSTIHVSNILQGLQNLRKLMGSVLTILSRNKMCWHIEAIGTCKIALSSGFVLDLVKTFYVPSFSRNLISVSRLVPLGYSFNFSDNKLGLFYNSDLVGYGILSDSLYCLDLQNDTSLTAVHVNVGMKFCVVNEDSSMLWHYRLRHIS